MARIDINDVEDLEVDGVDTMDYPKFCDAFFASAKWVKSGKYLTEDELISLGEDYPELLNQMAFEYYI